MFKCITVVMIIATLIGCKSTQKIEPEKLSYSEQTLNNIIEKSDYFCSFKIERNIIKFEMIIERDNKGNCVSLGHALNQVLQSPNSNHPMKIFAQNNHLLDEHFSNILMDSNHASLFTFIEQNDTKSKIKLPYTIANNAIFSRNKLCVFNVKNTSLYVGETYDCNLLEKTNYESDYERDVRVALENIFENKDYDLVLFNGNSFSEYVRPKSTLPIKYNIYSNDKSPYGEQQCVFSIANLKISHIKKSGSYDFHCDNIESEFIYKLEKHLMDETNGLYENLFELSKSPSPKKYIITDGLINELKPNEFNFKNYKKVTKREIVTILRNPNIKQDKFKINIPLSYGRSVSSDIFLGKNYVKNGDSYVARNAFNAQAIVDVNFYENYKLTLYPPDYLDNINDSVKNGLCMNSKGFFYFIEKGREFEKIKNSGDLSFYGTIKFYRGSRFIKESATISSPTENHTKWFRAEMIIDAVEQNGKPIDLYASKISCSFI